jgi:excisionase family DNA binding protein
MSLIKDLLTPDQIRVMYRGLYTFDQAALYLGKQKAFIKQEVAAGRIQISVIGGKRMIWRKTLDDYIQERTGVKE